ncbi:hypothetical protein KM043_015783 [Ampulex compressa]|nr:hypothetical protein KM043_015783 [Ampulex compressa]
MVANQTASIVTAPNANQGNAIHFEQSPLLDLTKNIEDQTNLRLISASPKIIEENSRTLETSASPPSEYQNSDNELRDHDQIFEAFNPLENYASIPNDTMGGSSRSEPRNLAQDASFPPILYSWNLPNLINQLDSSKNTINSKHHEDVLENVTKKLQGTDNSILSHGYRQHGEKRNKQVQVIIPYTSQYTPLPFHQQKEGHKDVHRNQGRKAPKSKNLNQAYTNGNLENQTTSIIEPMTITPTTQSTTDDQVNNSIDVHRLQKNIDNWTIQEYSRAIMSSTIHPSSRLYLLPSKNIPGEYLTTVGPATFKEKESVRTYTLAGFSFNDLEQKVSASERMEKTTNQLSNTTTETAENENESSTIKSLLNNEKLYVVVPQNTTKIGVRKDRKYEKSENNKYELTGYESIEKTYQVLPQAVNNLAVASTGPESAPLWGIMEHEKYASSSLDVHETKDENQTGPILYSGHSKVLRSQ